MAKKLLKIASIINLVIGGIVCAFSLLFISFGSFLGMFGIIIAFSGAIRLGVGAIYLEASEREENGLAKRKGWVLAASIVSILIGHFVTFILGVIAYSEMSKITGSLQEEVKELTPEEEKKRLKNLTALGCGLVILSGIIFAMTTWETLSGIGKTIALMIGAIIFFALSYLTENKFKLKNSSITYYILANAFTLFAFVAVGFFDIFGTWFSLNGDGASLYSTFIWVLVGALCYLAYLKYGVKNVFYLLDLSLLISLIHIFDFVNVGQDVILLVITLILAVFMVIPYKNELMKIAFKLANILFPIASLFVFIYIADMGGEDRRVFNLLSFGITFVVTYYFAVINKKTFYQIFAPIFAIGTAFAFSITSGVSDIIVFSQLLLITVILYVVGFYKREDKAFFTTTSIVSDLSLIYILIDTVNLRYNYLGILAGFLLLGISISVSISKQFSKYYFEKILEPIKVLLLSYSIYSLSENFNYSEDALFISLVGAVFGCICIFRRNLIKKMYFIGAVIFTAWSMGVNISSFAPVVQILNIIAFVILLLITVKTKENKFERCKELIFGLMLISIGSAVLNIFGHFYLKLIGIVLLALIYFGIFISSNKNNIFRYFSVVALLIPYIMILPISSFSNDVNYILYSLPWLALVFIYTRGFLSSLSLKTINIIETITLSMWYLWVGTRLSIEIAVFIGIFAFISLLIGYKKEEWSSLYYTGILFLIFNTLVQLRDFWTTIPVWAYILCAGLVLIGIVTYKEYSKVNKEDKVEVEIIEDEVPVAVKNVIDERSVVLGSVLYVIIVPIILSMIL